MKKILIAGVVVAVAALVLVAAGVAYAQASDPTDENEYGYGMMGGGGRMGRGHMFNQGAAEDGLLHEAAHDEMMAAFAAKLNIPVADLETRIANGETMAEIAVAEGYSLDEFRTLMLDVRSQAIDQALAAGKLTAEQAEWMKERGSGMMGGRGGRWGSSQEGFGREGCPMLDGDDL